MDGTILYLLVVPNELRREALRYIHDKESGHFGQHKTLLKAEEYFYWPNLRREAKACVRECITCQQFKAGNALQQQWQELPPVNQPLERITIDLTEMGSGALGHKYVLTVIDHFSRFVNPVSYVHEYSGQRGKKVRYGGGSLWSPKSAIRRQREGIPFGQTKTML